MKIPVWMVAMGVALTLTGVGCAGGDDDDDDDDDGGALSSGTYLISNAANGTAGCGLLFDVTQAEGVEFDLVVSGAVVTFEDLFTAPLDHDLNGNTFVYTATDIYDWSDPTFATGEGLSGPVDCVEHDIFTYTGTINDSGSFDYDLEVMAIASSGDPALCTAANDSAYGFAITFDCTDTGSFEANLQ